MNTQTPLDILKERLAKGEVSLDEYAKLKAALVEGNPARRKEKKEETKELDVSIDESALVPASKWRRFFAFSIDHTLAYAAIFFVTTLDPDLEFLGWFILIYLLFRDSFRGISVGKAVLGIRLIDTKTLRALSVWSGLKKGLILYLPLIVLGLVVGIFIAILENAYPRSSDVPEAFLMGIVGGVLAFLITLFSYYYPRLDSPDNKLMQTLPDLKSNCRAVTIRSYWKAKVEPVGR